jgi:hypothetical protein
MNLGLDYSGGRPTAAQIRAGGFTFVVRYLENGLGPGRANLTGAEYMDLTFGGIRTALVWESQANRAAAGFTAGQADARAADASAYKATALADLPIYFAVDFDIPDYAPNADGNTAIGALEKLGPVGAYFGGVLSVLPLARVGVYGGYWAVKRTLDAGLTHLAWQTLAWSGNQTDPRIHLLQRIGYVIVGGVECDVNEQRSEDFGWKPAAVTPAGKDDDMINFYVDDAQRKPDNTWPDTAVLMEAGGSVYPSTWAQYQAKKSEGTATLTGLPSTGAGSFADVRDSAVAQRAIPAKLDAVLAAIKAIPAGSGGTAGATKADVEQVVDAAFADHDATMTYRKIVGN